MAKSKAPKALKTRQRSSRTSSTPWYKSSSANSAYAFAALAAVLALLLMLLRGDSHSPKSPGASSKQSFKTSTPVQAKRLWKRASQGPMRGVVATQYIAAGTLVMLDTPFLIVPRSDNTTTAWEYLAQGVNSLSKPAQADFFNLPSSPNKLARGASKEQRTVNIFETNAIEAGHANAVFKNACYIKHSCNPNADIFYREDLGALLVNAVRDIAKGIEITTPHFDSSVFTREQRQQHFQETYGEACTCSACSLKGELLRTSDERRTQLRKIRQLVMNWGRGEAEPQDVLPAVEIAYKLLDEEDYKADLGWWAANAVQVCAADEDEEGTKKWANIAIEYYTAEAGSDSAQVAALKIIAEEPQRATAWGDQAAQKDAEVQEDPVDYDSLETPLDNSSDDAEEPLVKDEPAAEYPGDKGSNQ